MTSLYGGISKYTHWVADDFSHANIFSQIFPQYWSTKQPALKNSAPMKIKEYHEHKQKEVFAAVQTNSALTSPAECG